jgi:hypothetical protein
MQGPTGANLLIDLKKQFDVLPIDIKRQLIAVLAELQKETERVEPTSVAIYDRSTHSWFAKA